MAHALAGTRIRERRLAVGMRQTALARAAGVSPSYLNLIEHNKRNVSERALGRIALALQVPAATLEDGAESALVSDLRAAAAIHAAQSPETAGVEELIGRFPGWARIIAAQARQMRDLGATVAALTDRLNYDPHLQETLHEMLTTITAVRSTAAILATERDISPAQRDRFQDTVLSESVRLSDAAAEMVSYFDRVEPVPTDGGTPHEAVEQFLESRDHRFEELDTDPSDDVIARILASDVPKQAEAQARARYRLTRYAADARAMPLTRFAAAADATAYAPEVLARRFNVSLLAVFRRLSTLARDGIPAPAFGLVIINAAGQPLYRRPLPEFSLPRFASICALWPAFAALSAPGCPAEDVLNLPNGRAFLARSVALPLDEPTFERPPSYAAGMLVTALNDAYAHSMISATRGRDPLAVGTSCSLCQRQDCSARAEPSILPVPDGR